MSHMNSIRQQRRYGWHFPIIHIFFFWRTWNQRQVSVLRVLLLLLSKMKAPCFLSTDGKWTHYRSLKEPWQSDNKQTQLTKKRVSPCLAQISLLENLKVATVSHRRTAAYFCLSADLCVYSPTGNRVQTGCSRSCIPNDISASFCYRLPNESNSHELCFKDASLRSSSISVQQWTHSASRSSHGRESSWCWQQILISVESLLLWGIVSFSNLYL